MLCTSLYSWIRRCRLSRWRRWRYISVSCTTCSWRRRSPTVPVYWLTTPVLWWPLQAVLPLTLLLLSSQCRFLFCTPSLYYNGSSYLGLLLRYNRRRHLYCSAYKNAPWRQEFLGCWPAAVEQFTSWVVSARCRDRTVQTASEDVSVCVKLRCIATFLFRSLLSYLLTYLTN